MSQTWRNTGRSLRFFGLDGRALFLLLLILYHVTWWTFIVAVVGIIALVFLERKGYTFWNALRRLRILALGPRRPAIVGNRRGRSDR